MSGCIPVVIRFSLGHESGLCWTMERRRVAPHSGTTPRTDAGREPRSPRRRVLELRLPALRWLASPFAKGRGCRTTRSSCTRSLSRYGSRCTKWHPRHGDPAPAPRAPPPDRNIQVIVEIEARALTVERLFLVSERQDWTFGETLEYALDALELAMAKTATGRIPSDPRPRSLRR